MIPQAAHLSNLRNHEIVFQDRLSKPPLLSCLAPHLRRWDLESFNLSEMVFTSLVILNTSFPLILEVLFHFSPFLMAQNLILL